jgi:hypothetical protein
MKKLLPYLLPLLLPGCIKTPPSAEYYACKDSTKGALLIGITLDSAATRCGGIDSVIYHPSNP